MQPVPTSLSASKPHKETAKERRTKRRKEKEEEEEEEGGRRVGGYKPALVMACRYLLSWTSPAANTPGTLVSVEPGFVTT